MKKIILIFVLLIFSYAFCQENSVFWKIQKDSTVNYILGTNHIFDKSYIENDKTIFAALKSSSLILLENIESKDSIVNSRSNFDYYNKLSSNEKKDLNKMLEETI